jgi:hypothetical protein
MHINDALYGYLSTYAGLTALVSNRIYPDNLPQNPVLPAITFTCISTLRHHEFKNDSKMIDSTIQFTIWAASRKVTKTVSTQLRKALQDYSGIMSSVRISAVLLGDETDDFDDETRLYNTHMEFKIIHDEE